MTSCFKGKFKVTSPRGYRTLNGNREYHGGLDLVALGDDKAVYAIADGTVDATPYEATGFGYYVRQILPDGRRIYYGHMAKGTICVKAGQAIKNGDKLGVMGSTGSSTGAHTHIELRIAGTSKENLDICEYTGIPNVCGAYEADIPDYADIIKQKCDLSDSTIQYLKNYKYGQDLIRKIAENLA